MQNQAGEEFDDDEIAVPEPGFRNWNQCGYVRDQCVICQINRPVGTRISSKGGRTVYG